MNEILSWHRLTNIFYCLFPALNNRVDLFLDLFAIKDVKI